MQHAIDLREHALEISVDITVPEAQHLEALPSEMVIMGAITFRRRIEIMLAAVDFDDQMMLEADEIHDELVARRLPAKVKSSLSP